MFHLSPCLARSPAPLTDEAQIKDPEHPYTLEELAVVSEGAVRVDQESGVVKIEFKPTVPHCAWGEGGGGAR